MTTDDTAWLDDLASRAKAAVSAVFRADPSKTCADLRDEYRVNPIDVLRLIALARKAERYRGALEAVIDLSVHASRETIRSTARSALLEDK